MKVNSSPSLAADTPQDYELKFGMLDDLLTVIDMEKRLPQATNAQVQRAKTLHESLGVLLTPRSMPHQNTLATYSLSATDFFDVRA